VTPNSWLSSQIQCEGCGALIAQGSGLLCANFGQERGTGIPICKGAWHGKCYRQAENDAFPVLEAEDLDDSMLTAVDLASDNPERFKLARDDDNLMCPFQCDDCQFQNLKKRAPGVSDIDGVLLLCIRCANLDALWAREPATVHSNRREGARLIELSKQLGLENPYPRRGPCPVKIRLALVSLQ